MSRAAFARAAFAAGGLGPLRLRLLLREALLLGPALFSGSLPLLGSAGLLGDALLLGPALRPRLLVTQVGSRPQLGFNSLGLGSHRFGSLGFCSRLGSHHLGPGDALGLRLPLAALGVGTAFDLGLLGEDPRLLRGRQSGLLRAAIGRFGLPAGFLLPHRLPLRGG